MRQPSNVGLPDRWFAALFPSHDIRINFGASMPGQTGRLFPPFDGAIGRKMTDNIVMSWEVGAPIIRAYPVYNFKADLRVKVEFDCRWGRASDLNLPPCD